MTGAGLPLSFRLALRELRGGLSGFYIFVACIALGVAAIAGINSVSRALTEGISREGRVILGGDLAFILANHQASPEEIDYLQAKGRLGRVATMRAMVRRAGEDGQALVELKAVDAAYPHGGKLEIEGGADGQKLMAAENGVFGALAAPELVDRLGISPGDRIRLGGAELEFRGLIASEPDKLAGGMAFGPRLMISLDALAETGLVRPGSLITWTYRLRLPDRADGARAMGAVRSQARELFPEAGWNIRTRTNAAPGLSRNIERFSQFLTLVGLTALVVGGVGVANAVTSFVDLKRPVIATLKCLGASSSLVFRTYMTQILLIAGLGILIGLAIGAAMPFAARWALADLVPVSGRSLYWRELGLAIVYGLLVTLAFALGPLGRARQIGRASCRERV